MLIRLVEPQQGSEPCFPAMAIGSHALAGGKMDPTPLSPFIRSFRLTAELLDPLASDPIHGVRPDFPPDAVSSLKPVLENSALTPVMVPLSEKNTPYGL